MGASFTVVTGNRLELLLDELAARMARAPLLPLQQETILVANQGIARWLTLELTRRQGIAGSLDLPFPGTFLQRLAERSAQAPSDRDERAFARPALTLRLFRLLGDAKLQRELGAAAAYCKDDHDQHKRLQLATRLAQCFDDYQLYREDVLARWERGEESLEPHANWQARLWRALLHEVAPNEAAAARPPAGQGLLFAAAAPADRPTQRLQRLRGLLDDPARAVVALPARLAVFGIAAMPPAFLQLLVRMAAHIEVTVYAPRPTEHWFGDERRTRRQGPFEGGHPLLQAWGQQSREFFDALLEADPAGDGQPLGFADPGRDTLLHALQHDLLHLHDRRQGGEQTPLQLRTGDASLRVHSAHGPLREMEIVRDQILDALEHDRTLTPADVVVLLPDIETYAPYAHAVFGPLHKLLPFHLADRSPAADLPVAATFLRLCALARGRCRAPELLLLLEEPAVARRFQLTRPELIALRAWVERTRIRWGRDGEHRRAAFDLPAVPDHTFAAGLDRLAIGACTGPVDELVLGVLPAGDGTAGRAELLDRALQFFAATMTACKTLQRPHTLAHWATAIDDVLAALFAPEDAAEREGQAHLQAAARALRELQEVAAFQEELAPAAFTSWLEAELASRGDGRGFLHGAITFAALRPLRCVPSRVLCISGLGEGAFPRRQRRPPFDLLAHDRRPLDRSPRDDDRQAFLDALLAARDRLVLSWVGRSHKDNSECAPSPLLSELLEHIETAFVAADGGSARAAVFVDHPLQVWSPRYGGPDPRLFTWAPRAVTAPPPWLPVPAAPLPPPAALPQLLALDDLLQFWRHPARWYCRRVLEVRFRNSDDHADDAEPFALHNLDRYQLHEAALAARLRGERDAVASGTARHSGLLPAGPLGELAHADLTDSVQSFWTRLQQEGPLQSVAVEVQGSDWTLRGVLDGVAAASLVRHRPARLKAKDRLFAFILHAVKCAAIEQGARLPLPTRLLGLDATITAPSCAPALPHLQALVDGYRKGQQAPLPFFEHASFAFARHAADQDPHHALAQAHKAFLPGSDDRSWAHDTPDADVEFCWRASAPLDTPEFTTWARRIAGPALLFFDGEAAS